jgi:hypothetical protein
MKRRALLALAVATVAAGCTSVPVSTLWRLRSFGPDQLFALDPKDLRAAARVDSRATIQRVTLTLDIEPPDGAARRTYRLPLDQPASDPRLEPPPPDRRWFAFALSSQGLAEYQRIKREYAAIPKGSKGTLRISSEEGSVPPVQARAFPARLDVLFDPREGYFTLIRETRLDLSRAENK